MFSPLAPIQSDSRSQAAIDSLLARIDAIDTVLAVLNHQVGTGGHNVAPTLATRAALAELDLATIERMAVEMDAVSAVLQAGYTALQSARKRGHWAHVAAAMLMRESAEAFAAALSLPVVERSTDR